MQILSGIHQVDGVSSNVFLLVEDAGLTAIDSGGPGSGPKILAYIAQIGRRPEDLRRIVLTHQHLDHVGGAAYLAARTGAAVLAHPLDAPAIEGKARRELPRNALLRLIFQALLLPRLQPVSVTRALTPGETLPVMPDDGGLQVVATPGHTSGHCSLYLPRRHVLFAGDALTQLRGAVQAPPAIFTIDMPTARRSLAALAGMHVEASLAGHGRPILSGAGDRIAAAVKPT
jgi:glyoxylase-like metal-dependent hydrolase (beta-lactamase superfamily II)